MILAVDPGERIGLSWWAEDHRHIKKEIVDLDTFLGILEEEVSDDFAPVRTVVYEDFRLRSMRALQQSGSKMPASQVIGAIKLYGKITGAKLVEQSVDGLYIGARHANIKLPKGHVKDDVSAYCHGVYYHVGQGFLTPKDFR